MGTAQISMYKMVRWALLIFCLSLISQNALGRYRWYRPKWQTQVFRRGNFGNFWRRIPGRQPHGSKMNQRMAKIKPPEENNSVEVEPLDLSVFSPNKTIGRTGFNERMGIDLKSYDDYNDTDTFDYEYQIEKEEETEPKYRSMKNTKPKDMQNVVEGLLQKYQGSKTLLVGIPYPVVYEVPAAPTRRQNEKKLFEYDDVPQQALTNHNYGRKRGRRPTKVENFEKEATVHPYYA